MSTKGIAKELALRALKRLLVTCCFVGGCAQVMANDTGATATSEGRSYGAQPESTDTGRRAPAMARIQQQGQLNVAMKNLHHTAPNAAGIVGLAPFLVQPVNGECSVCNNGSKAKLYNNEVCGFDVEVAYLAAQKLGVSLNIDTTPNTYDGVIDYLSWAKADIAISTLSSTLRRAQYVAFSEPYLELGQTLLVNRLAMEGLDLTRAHIVAGMPRGVQRGVKLPALTIAVEGGSSYAEFADDLFRGHNILAYDDLLKAMIDLIDGKQVFAIYADNMQIMQLLSDNKKAGLFLKVVDLRRADNISMAVSYDTPSLLNWSNLFLREIKMNGELAALKYKCGLGGKSYE